MVTLKGFLNIFRFLVKEPSFKLRGCDELGCGHFGAPRKLRVHKGLDLKLKPGKLFCSPFAGEIVKLGWAYRSDPHFRIIDIKVSEEMMVRAFYVEPMLSVGDKVIVGQVIGKCQDVSAKHGAGMINHVHFEVIINGVHVDPKHYLRIEND